MHQRFGIAFDRIIELIHSGCTLEGAVQQYPEPIDIGAFNAWMHRDPTRKRTYEEAKEFRAEVWAGRMMCIAEGVNPNDPTALPEDVTRSKLRVDTLKFFLGADNRKTYAPTQNIDVTTTNISITAALEQARGRVSGITLEHQPSSEAAIGHTTETDGENE